MIRLDKIVNFMLLNGTGVNPMITVEAISYMTSRAVMDRLNVSAFFESPSPECYRLYLPIIMLNR